MPSLREWIEAQLKKGYSASQIKAALSRRGYPSRAVAEVDKVAPPRNDKKRLGLTIVVLVIVVSLVFVYYNFQGEKQVEEIIKETPATAPEEPIAAEAEITEETPTAPIEEATAPEEVLAEETEPALPEFNPK